MTPASEISELPELQAAVANPARSRANDFYELTKPRLNFLVLITTMVGFYMAQRHWNNWALLLNALVGTAFTAAAAGVLNQVVERDFDKLMPRTAHRPLPAGRIAPNEAVLYGTALGIVGVVYLAILVNVFTAVLGLITLGSYIFVYTPMKRWTTLNTVIGAIPGAIPPMMGWTAARNSISPEAAALFCILFFWQMPHFLSLAILYRRDYEAGGFKMLPLIDPDLSMTGRQIVLYTAALIPVTLIPTVIGMTGAVYFVVAFILGAGFLWMAVACAAASGDRSHARRLFFASIIYLPLLLAAMMMNKL